MGQPNIWVKISAVGPPPVSVNRSVGSLGANATTINCPSPTRNEWPPATTRPYTDDTRIYFRKGFLAGPRPALVVAGQEEGETITTGKRPNTKKSTPTPKDKRCVSTTYPTTPTAVKQHKEKSKWKPADSQRQKENKCKKKMGRLA